MPDIHQGVVSDDPHPEDVHDNPAPLPASVLLNLEGDVKFPTKDKALKSLRLLPAHRNAQEHRGSPS